MERATKPNPRLGAPGDLHIQVLAETPIMPRNKLTKETSISSLWHETPQADTEKLEEALKSWSDPSVPKNITQNILAHFLHEIRAERGSFNDDLKSCIKEVCREVAEIGNRMDNL
ncbi:hypothetical protein NDU88_003850 [Pleurodeles waltl]|uniref:Uncharacterized protein n=1 Tax=Pleurodeles waltl TaxID=8319 RepID=A0AAV7T6A3_PLEWA|nr:hypothetical protein NDU88_003850 [Pleurodeles waltl]